MSMSNPTFLKPCQGVGPRGRSRGRDRVIPLISRDINSHHSLTEPENTFVILRPIFFYLRETKKITPKIKLTINN
jgi:hypothetical protein